MGKLLIDALKAMLFLGVIVGAILVVLAMTQGPSTGTSDADRHTQEANGRLDSALDSALSR